MSATWADGQKRPHMSAQDMDQKRQENVAYEYLCHLEEARTWMSRCLDEELPPATELEPFLTNGVVLAKLAHFFAPAVVKKSKIYDPDLEKFNANGLHFKHTDNINFWMKAMTKEGLPTIFFPTTTDIYDRKNIPKTIYCLHALSIYLHRLGKAPAMQNLVGEAEFTQEEISAMQAELDKYGIQMPAFGKIGGILSTELTADDAAVHAAVLVINEAIDNGNVEEIVKKLNLPAAGVLDVIEENAQEYLERLVSAKQAKIEKTAGKDEADLDVYDRMLTQSEIVSNVKEMNSVVKKAKLSSRLNTLLAGGEGRSQEAKMASLLEANSSVIPNFDPANMAFYLTALSSKKDLSFDDILEAVEEGNRQAAHFRDVVKRVEEMSGIIVSGDVDKLLTLLQDPLVGLCNVDKKNKSIYLKMMASLIDAKGGNLTADELQEVINNVNEMAEQAAEAANFMARLNNAILSGDAESLLQELQAPTSTVKNIRTECGQDYLDSLRAAASERQDRCPWANVAYSDNLSYYYNSKTGEQQWEVPAGFSPDSCDFSQGEIQPIVTRITNAFKRQKLLEENEHVIVELQARWRGTLLRRAFNNRLAYLKSHRKQIAIIQAYCRGYQQRLRYRSRQQFLHDHVKNAVTIQAACRGWKARKILRIRKAFFDDHVSAVIKIQANTRGYIARQYYRKLLENKKPPASALRKFLHLLESNERDFQEETEIQRKKADVVSTIRQQKDLEENLNIMDIKIGLLVKNRLDLDDVVHQSAKLKKKDVASATKGLGLKSLSKENRDRLENYQHLFYLLQTNPTYLAKLIFQMPTGRSTRFIENVIFTLFNYASNQREEYLLMKLFETAMRCELKPMDNVEDIAKGNATVIKMVITFNRGARGQNSLKELVLPLVNRIISDKDLLINVNPVDIYKAWINQRESETGESCGLPYDVSTEQALSYPEVKERISGTVKTLQNITEEFVTSVTESVAKIPYGIRYFSMRMRQALSEQFPHASKEEILRVVGNFLYYRFMNPAVVAPDAFDIVELSLDKGLTVEQRRNLGSIAKVLHHASANKLFDGENSALSPLNSLIEDSHVKFLQFFQKASTTEDSEVHYNQDEYAEVTRLTKPVVYISVKEICNTHMLLEEHADSITADENDLLLSLMKEIGHAPQVHEILGGAYDHPGTTASAEMISQWEERVAEAGKSEISLLLKNRFDVQGEEDGESLQNVFKNAKRMAVAILQSQPGDNLKVILETPSNAEQQLEFRSIMEKRQAFDRKRAKEDAEKQKSSGGSPVPRAQTDSPDSEVASLSDTKAKLRVSLAQLEKEKLVESSNNYQAILDSMAKDIRNQHRHRQQRKKELEKLAATLASLDAKGKYFEDQREYYEMYVNACISNLTKPKSKKKDQGHSKKVLKYNAYKLYEKGVILEIDGLNPNQFKSVAFEIEAGEAGKFNVSAKFMGVAMDTVVLVFEDLLQLQYERVAVLKMFGRAKINVNLLIFLINKKFYGQ